MPKDLSELVIRKLEVPGRARVRVVNRETGLREVGEGINRVEAKWRGYAALAHKEGKTGAAIAYLQGAEQARLEYFQKLRDIELMRFDDEIHPDADDIAFMKGPDHGNQRAV